MKKSILLFAISVLALGACRSLRISDFHTSETIPQRLPRLGLLVHERSFADAFYAALNREVILTNITAGPYIPAPWEVHQKTDQAMSDVFQVLDNELFDHINRQGGERYGHARFKLRTYQRRNAGWGWMIPSIFTLGTANLLGMPYKVYRIDLELQLEIVDANGKILQRYDAPGTGKAKVAAYHGYDALTAIRKANLVAIQDGLSKIKTRMAGDVATLSEQLQTAGVAHPLDIKK